MAASESDTVDAMAQGSGQVSLTYMAPPADLASYCGPAYLFHADKPKVSDHTRAELAQVRFMLSGVGEYVFPDARRVETPRHCLLGPTNSATYFEVDGPLRVFGVALLPLGWAALRLGDASRIADDVGDLSTMLGEGVAPLMQQFDTALAGPGGQDAAAALLWAYLRGRMRPVGQSVCDFIAATDTWLADEKSPKIDVLQTMTGLSARQVARLCNQYYGASPKFLARKYRALRCASLLAHGDMDWADLAEDAFYDQSHFIREFKHFIGLTPNQLRANASLVLRLTMGRRGMDGDIALLSRIG